MRAIGKYWKVILAVLLLIAAALIYFMIYRPARDVYDMSVTRLDTQIQAQQAVVPVRQDLIALQDQLPEAEAALTESRAALYDNFPVDLKEEDQILYILDLEKQFGTEIDFDFGETTAITRFTDGAILRGLTLTVNYQTSYQGFKDMVEFLSTDERITSVRYAVMGYDAESDSLVGTVTIERYLLSRPGASYESPDVTSPGEVGKDNIFD